MPPAPELKATLNLPQTAFPMKANLPQNEPLRLARWASLRLYDELRKAGNGRPSYILHDGPPYANGPIHLGHALNKGLKDFVVKSRTMAGYDAPYVPGYDCHGLPIEIKVDEQLGRRKLEMPAAEVLDACRAYAQKFIDLQTKQFERIGIFGRWNTPYKTMSRDYEAKTLEAFYGFLEKGFVYRGLKPVYWCIHDRTALADAEIEYQNHTSPSVYVRYKLTSPADALDPALAGREVYTIIWTTTPWTLPASLAVAFHPDFEYVALETHPGAPSNPAAASSPGWVGDHKGPVYIVAAELAASVIAACKLEGAQEIARFKGAKLEHTTYQHPFLERSVLGVLGTYVTADTGTGAVHTAPAHGAEDFYTGQKYGLDLTCRVDAAGRIHVDEAAWPHVTPPPYDGLTIWKANPIIIAMLTERGALLASGDLEHSYPHCWRCHHPVIFRATEQWFINIDHEVPGTGKTLRQLTIEEIDKVVWDPAWGKERITNMMATRPDWCISRQRIWGVPIAVFMCEGCNQPVLDAGLNRKIVQLFEDEGAEAWHNVAADALLPAGTQCASCGKSEFRRETDILDVWFDSGTSWFAVCEADPDLKPAYSEFQSATNANAKSVNAANAVTVNAANAVSVNAATVNAANAVTVNAANAVTVNAANAVTVNAANAETVNAANAESVNAAVAVNAANAESVNAANAVTVNAANAETVNAAVAVNAANAESVNAANAVTVNAAVSVNAARQGATSVAPKEAKTNDRALTPASAPVVLYLEGGDQHRGWFHSSLLTSVALRGRAPYSHCNTVGWTLDEQGRAMSKSLGNGVDPVDIAERLGGEIVRLWVASIDFREDMAASENLMARCAEIYRKLRNTFRFLLGTLNGFNPATDAVAEADLLPLDRYMLARTRELTEKILAWYEAFEFHRIYHAVNEFAIVDLSSFYLDVLKDRMYTFAPTNPARRSAQTVLWKITETLARLVAPILSFTADEVWEYLPPMEGREISVHLALFPKPEEVFSENPSQLLSEWKELFEFRNEVLRLLEIERQNKVIGKGLEADVQVLTRGDLYDFLKMYESSLKELLNVSRVDLKLAHGTAGIGELGREHNVSTSEGTFYRAKVEILPASGSKCARCWNFMPEVSNYGIWQNVCTRCQDALREMNIEPPQAEDAA
jgi:isoleucyl-tRNA synthetase